MMQEKTRFSQIGHSDRGRQMWLVALVVLALAAWPGRAILASALQSVGVEGQVRLQGRLDQSGVEIQVQASPSSGDAQSQSAQLPQVTGVEGVFTVEGQGVTIITARMLGYLDAQATISADTGGPISLGPTTLYGGEVTGDNVIDISDLAYMGAHFNADDAIGDINGDGQVDILDLSMAAANFKMSGPTPWGQ